jgi:hypothetical protein
VAAFGPFLVLKRVIGREACQRGRCHAHLVPNHSPVWIRGIGDLRVQTTSAEVSLAARKEPNSYMRELATEEVKGSAGNRNVFTIFLLHCPQSHKPIMQQRKICGTRHWSVDKMLVRLRQEPKYGSRLRFAAAIPGEVRFPKCSVIVSTSEPTPSPITSCA